MKTAILQFQLIVQGMAFVTVMDNACLENASVILTMKALIAVSKRDVKITVADMVFASMEDAFVTQDIEEKPAKKRYRNIPNVKPTAQESVSLEAVTVKQVILNVQPLYNKTKQ